MNNVSLPNSWFNLDAVFYGWSWVPVALFLVVVILIIVKSARSSIASIEHHKSQFISLIIAGFVTVFIGFTLLLNFANHNTFLESKVAEHYNVTTESVAENFGQSLRNPGVLQQLAESIIREDDGRAGKRQLSGIYDAVSNTYSLFKFERNSIVHISVPVR